MTNKNYCIMRIEKIKSLLALGRAYNHNYRTTETAAPRAVKELRDRNQELLADDTGIGDRNFVKVFQSKVRESEYYKTHKVRKNAVPAVEVLLSFSKEQAGRFDIEEWKAENVKWLQDTFGKENVISAMFHDDERRQDDPDGTGCHIHAIVLPFDERGCLNARDIIGYKSDYIKRQTEYAARMSRFGLVRGEMDKNDQHLSPAMYHKRVDKELDREKQYIPAPEEKETASEYAKRLEEPLWQIARDHTDVVLDFERENFKRKQEEDKKKRKKSLDDKLKEIENDKRERKQNRDFEELRALLGWGDGTPSRAQMHEAKKRLRIANNIVEAIATYPDREYAHKVNEEMAVILKHNKDRKKAEGKDTKDMGDIILRSDNE